MPLHAFIRFLREREGMTQDGLAKVLKLSRPTVVQIEKGEREISVAEAKKLASIFGMTLDDFLNERDTATKVAIEAEKKAPKESTIRISVPQKNLKKFKEVLLYILSKVGSKPNVGESVINKLLYFIDFDYYEKYEEQLIGATYIKNHFGPTPCELIKVVKDMKEKGEIEEVKSKYFTHEQRKLLPLRQPNLSAISARELELIDDVLARLSDKSATDLKWYSHEDVPWKVHKDGEKISYESVFYRDEKHSVRSYADAL